MLRLDKLSFVDMRLRLYRDGLNGYVNDADDGTARSDAEEFAA